MTTINIGTQYSAPSTTVTAAQGSATGNLSGNYRWKVTYVTILGETLASSATGIVAISGQASLTAIPTGPAGVTARKLYRTAAGGSVYKLVATVSDNTTTTYTDNIADGSLGAVEPGFSYGRTIQNIKSNLVFDGLYGGGVTSIANTATTADTAPTVTKQYTVLTSNAASGVLKLPTLSSDLIGVSISIKNNDGLNACTLTPASGQTINSGANLSLAANTLAILVADSATNWLKVN